MKRLVHALLIMFAFQSAASADEIRVLVSFSDGDHQVEKVFNVATGKMAAIARVRRSAEAALKIRSGVIVEWLDSNGRVISQEVIADPRITHPPTYVGPVPDKFLKPKGVYLVNGPVDSARVRLNFPAVVLSSRMIPAVSAVMSLSP